MNNLSSCVAVYPPSFEEGAGIPAVIKKLLSFDYPIEKLSVIGKGSLSENQTIGLVKTVDKIRYKGDQDQLWHELWDLLAGEALFLIPELGSLAAAGSLSSVLLAPSTDENSPQNTTDLGKALHSVGIPESSILYYESLLKTGWVILVVQGDNQDIEHAGELIELSQNGAEISLHFA